MSLPLLCRRSSLDRSFADASFSSANDATEPALGRIDPRLASLRDRSCWLGCNWGSDAINACPVDTFRRQRQLQLLENDGDKETADFCHPVAFMIAAMVVPLGCRSRARTFSCLVLGRRKAGLTVLRFAVLFGCVVGAMFVRMLLCDMVRSSQLRRHMRRHRRNPTVATSPAGRDPRAQEACVSIGTTNALFAAEVQSYLQGKCAPAGSFRGRPWPNSYP